MESQFVFSQPDLKNKKKSLDTGNSILIIQQKMIT